MVVYSAASAAITVGYEATFKGGTSVAHQFGKEVKGNGLKFENSQQALGQLYTREITDYLYGKNIGNVTMEYVLSNPWFFTSLFNDPVQTTTTPTWTYVWSTDPTLQNGIIRQAKTMNLVIAENRITSEVRNAKGAITTNLTIKAALDQPINVSQSITWGHEDAITTSFPVSLPTDEGFTPMNFVNATIEAPIGSALAVVQDFDLTIDTGQELLWGTGSADASDVRVGLFNITGKINKAKQTSDFLNDVMGRAPIASLRIFISNGLSAGNLKSIEILLTNVGFSSHETNGLTPAELILEGLEFQAERCQVTAINGENITVPMV